MGNNVVGYQPRQLKVKAQSFGKRVGVKQ